MMTKFLSLGLLLASPILAQKPINVRWGRDRVKLGEKTFILRDATASDAYVEMTAEMMKAGFWKYYKMQYDRYGYTKRGNEHKDRFVHENEFNLCLADHYLVHNFVDGVSATAESSFPTYKTIEGTPLRTSIWNGSDQQNKNSNSISEDHVEFSISEVKCKGDSSLWIMKTVYNVMIRNIPVDGVTVDPVMVERDGDNSSQLSCENCMAKLTEEQEKNADLEAQLQAALEKISTLESEVETCNADLTSCNENGGGNNSGEACSLVEDQLRTQLSECNAEKDQCNQDLSNCNAENDACSTCQTQLDECNASQDACIVCQTDLATCQNNLSNAEDECNSRLSTCQSERDTCNQEKEECNSNLFTCTSNNKCVGGLEPIGHDDFDNYRANMDWKHQMNWQFYWVDIIHAPEVQNVIFARIPHIGSKGAGAIVKCRDIGMVLATVRGQDEDDLLYAWHNGYEKPESEEVHPNIQHKPTYGLLGSLTNGESPANQAYWYWALAADARNGLYGEWGSEGYDLGYDTYSRYGLKWPSIPVERCYFRGTAAYDEHGCQYMTESVNVVYTTRGWTAHRYNHNNWDALCEWRAPVNAARDFKLPDTTDCFELEDAAQKYVRYFSCPWIKSDKAYITTKCEGLGMNLASVRSDAEIKALNNAAKFETGNVYPTSAEYSNYNWKWGDASMLVIDDISWSDNGARGNPGSTTELKVGNGNVVPVEPGFGQYSVLCEVRQEPPVVVEESSE